MSKRFIITCCGRSGSKYVASALSNMGISVIHEMGDDWPYPSDWGIKYIAQNPSLFKNYRGFVGWKWPLHTPVFASNFQVKFHLVRDPIKAITSATTHADSLFKYIESKLGLEDYGIEMDEETRRLSRAISYWIRYNEAFDENKEILNLESFCYGGESLEKFCGLAGYPNSASKLVDFLPKDVNARPNAKRRVSFDWNMLQEKFPVQAEKISVLATKYGYEY